MSVTRVPLSTILSPVHCKYLMQNLVSALVTCWQLLVYLELLMSFPYIQSELIESLSGGYTSFFHIICTFSHNLDIKAVNAQYLDEFINLFCGFFAFVVGIWLQNTLPRED